MLSLQTLAACTIPDNADLQGICEHIRNIINEEKSACKIQKWWIDICYSVTLRKLPSGRSHGIFTCWMTQYNGPTIRDYWFGKLISSNISVVNYTEYYRYRREYIQENI